jgi:hypothetical protein
MSDKTTKPLITDKLSIFDWGIELTPDGLSKIVTVPSGKTLDLTDGRFTVSGDKKRLEVRVK